jgi:hypothetical protein
MASADDELAKAFYRMGFRTLDEVAEAPDEELLTIEGVETLERATEVRGEALQAIETQRIERIEEAKQNPEPLSDHDHMRLAPSMTERVVEALERAGYKSLETLLAEKDVDRLAIKSGLGHQKAREALEGAAHYLEHERADVESQQRQARIRADEEARAAAEAEAQAQAEEAAAPAEAPETTQEEPAATATSEETP